MTTASVPAAKKQKREFYLDNEWIKEFQGTGNSSKGTKNNNKATTRYNCTTTNDYSRQVIKIASITMVSVVLSYMCVHFR